MSNTTCQRRLVIIGGGVGGVAAFAAAVRFRIAHSVDIIDPAGIGRCVAFSAIDPALLCNTSVETMSILDDDPDDFLAYLHSIGVPASRDAFVPRFYVSNYLVSRHSSFATLAHSVGISHRLVQATARRITKVPTGGYHVLLDDDTKLEASDVLVCTGTGESYVPDVVRAHVGTPRLFECLYPEERVLKQLAPRSRVLVLGSRLSAVDAALILCRAGHSVVAASPSGRLPAVRTATPRMCAIPVDTGAFARLDLRSPTLSWRILRIVSRAARAVRGQPLRKQVAYDSEPVERLRLEVELARRGATDWQSIIVGHMDAAERRLRDDPPAQQRTAIGEMSRPVGRYLFACPVQNGEKLLGYAEQNLFRVKAATPAALYRDETWRVQWHDGSPDAYDAVVCATGFHKAYLRVSADKLALDADMDADIGVEPHVSTDLRVWMAGASQAERIWTLGLASHLGSPMINAVYQIVRQAGDLCRHWRGLDELNHERLTVAAEAG
ncbi:Hydroxyacylglutathione hydrolase [Paraburkholderia caribensis MBA4]|uniref:Hydroxyacylglutathione hydrolase n=2 Tax=Paraburkholderia caribensis TaxID=75105 RepID=A0A0N7JUY7_9BURK|nr:FAD/NAD(P)-binding protein [Paraburkholderia caribensis]ALL67725.1 Hydroxyacylglutathione hydrolase [Paraburkholderia caribensis MBA4]